MATTGNSMYVKSTVTCTMSHLCGKVQRSIKVVRPWRCWRLSEPAESNDCWLFTYNCPSQSREHHEESIHEVTHVAARHTGTITKAHDEYKVSTGCRKWKFHFGSSRYIYRPNFTKFLYPCTNKQRLAANVVKQVSRTVVAAQSNWMS